VKKPVLPSLLLSAEAVNVVTTRCACQSAPRKRATTKKTTNDYRIPVTLPDDIRQKVAADARRNMRSLSATICMILARHYSENPS